MKKSLKEIVLSAKSPVEMEKLWSKELQIKKVKEQFLRKGRRKE